MYRKFIIPLILIIIFNIYWTISTANNPLHPDFSAFYYAASVVMDSSVSDMAIYDRGVMSEIAGKYGIEQPVDFIYSMPVSYILAPFALMPYHVSIIAWNLLSLVLYVISVLILLKLAGVDRVNTMKFVSISLIWSPFLLNQFLTQSNSIILFLITFAVFAVTKNKPYVGGLLIGIAALFKLFPIAIALVFGLKNWRIVVAFAVTLGTSFLITGALRWFDAIQDIFPRYSCIYIILNSYGRYWFFIYAAIIALSTAFIAYRSKETNYLQLASLSIPTVMLILPIFQIHYMTIMIITYIYLFSIVPNIPRWLYVLGFASFVIINFNYNLSLMPTQTIGLLLLWIVIVYQITYTNFLTTAPSVAVAKPPQNS